MTPIQKNRLILIDLLRTLALAGMVAFHLTYDLDALGFIAPGTATSGFFWYFARIVAGSFIFLAGVGLWLSHGGGIRWRPFLLRLAKILAAAALVTVASHFALPGLTIFYGILHSIAVSSLVGLLFLRLSPAAMLVLAGLVFALPWFWSHPVFDGWLIWTGLSGRVPATADYEPLFPWFAPFLAGMACAKALSLRGLWPRLALPGRRWLRLLAWPGRHSLTIYLIHQPVLIAALLGLRALLL
ncbi:heparan-alpha-glucosaminide N-acetyltransferase [Pseudogemmobacter sonorensis]|uniref:heparan-alpha-glucosaminide N-acetyltransferase n=1 Tax=Pseudogemmobacter sonorensis TaxID=2989681 RepID=UPI003692C226